MSIGNRFARRAIPTSFLAPTVGWRAALLALLLGACGEDVPLYSPLQPSVIRLDLPDEGVNLGGLVTADVDGDGRRDVIVTREDYIGAFSVMGGRLWSRAVDIQLSSGGGFLPGYHAAGVQVSDIDGDAEPEVLFLSTTNTLTILHGSTGETKQEINLSPPPGENRWELLLIANFRGKGDRDLFLQATEASAPPDRVGRYIAAFALNTLSAGRMIAKPIWQRGDFQSEGHGGARLADLDGDGRDEVIGPMIVGPDGSVLFSLPVREEHTNHIDGVYVADVRPDIPGLEVVALEEGNANRIFLYNQNGLIWETDYKNQEPQNAALGEFDVGRPGLEIWCRSGYDDFQVPFVFDARGELIAVYRMDDVAPSGWTTVGVEVIHTIHWTGRERQFAAAKERHESGDVAIFDPISGTFLHRFRERADRLYVADLYGDWREEVVVLSGKELHIYASSEPNPRPDHPSLWSENHYARSKMNGNYYNP